MTKLLKSNLNFLTFFVFLTIFAFGQDQTLKIQFQKAFETTAENRDLSWLTPEQRTILIQQARIELNSPTADVKTSAKERLVALEDEATMQQLSSEAKAGDGLARSILITYGDETALKYLTETIYNGSSNIAGGGGDVVGISEMDGAVLGAFRIIVRSKSFPAQTRNWAKQIVYRARTTMVGLGPQGTATTSIRLWWEHNKEAVLAKRYQDATWLPPQDHESPTISPPNGAGPTVSSPSGDASHELNHVQLATHTDGISIPPWIYGIIVLILGVIVTLWYRSRPKQ